MVNIGIRETNFLSRQIDIYPAVGEAERQQLYPSKGKAKTAVGNKSKQHKRFKKKNAA